MTGMTFGDMEQRVKDFKERLPALSRLIDALESVGQRFGHVLAVDGRWGRIRARDGEMLVHTILNVLLQMTGSLCMKWGRCMAEDALLKEGVALDGNGWPSFLADQHDEWQMEIPEEEVSHWDYDLPCEDWKAEEKRTHTDEEGRVWSAPEILAGDPKKDDIIIVQRKYHRAGQVLAEQMTAAGEFLGIRIPLAGEYKIDYSWEGTH